MFGFLKKVKCFGNEVISPILQEDMNKFYQTCPDTEKYIPRLSFPLKDLFSQYISGKGGYIIEQQKVQAAGIKKIEINTKLPRYYSEQDIEFIYLILARIERKINAIIKKSKFNKKKKYKIVFYGVDDFSFLARYGNSTSTLLFTPRMGFPVNLAIIDKLTGTEYSFSCQPEFKEA